MKKRSFLLAGSLALECFLGCGPAEFPQYSGNYKIQEVSYSSPSFIGDKQFPPTLRLVDRMEHIGSYWKHYLLLEFTAKTENQAEGAFTLGLDDLVRIDSGVWPNDRYGGAGIYQEQKVNGTSAFCSYQYLYFLYLETIPSVEILRKVYPGKGDYIGDDPVTKMPLYESLDYPEEVDFDPTEWYNAIEKNKSITLYFTFFRHLKVEQPGWENGYKDCILPVDMRRDESLTFTYLARPEDLDDEVDIRKGEFKEIKGSQPSISFFREVAPDIK